jgi:hypothetical protein
MRSVVLVVIASWLGAGVARAEESRSPRPFWFGAALGLALTPDEESDLESSLAVGFAGGIDVGMQRISGGRAISVDADVLPAGGIYRGRASVVLGYGFTTKYSEPCVGPAGYSCRRIYGGRDVRSVFGLAVGGEVGTAPDGEMTALAVGLGFRSQFSIDATFVYDVGVGAAGGAFDFSYQFGPAYIAVKMRGIGSSEASVPLLMTFSIGYAARMWPR